MSQRVLISVMILFCLRIASICATIEADQTVNPATGEMQFLLPIATVEGINGNNFPIALNYKAGIRLSDPSSSIGLGFGCGVGSISRQVVYVPDDNTGGRNNYLEGSTPPNCVDRSWWWALVSVLEIVLFLVCAYLGSVAGGYIAEAITAATSIIMKIGLGLSGLAISAAIALGAQMVMYTVTMIGYSPADFSAGGTHVPAYDPGPITSIDHGRGIFKGSTNDLPDVYFVNTPIISGRLVYAGPGDNGYYFRFQQTGGSGKLDQPTIQAHYNVNSEEFIITMQNGMKLFFGGSADYVARFNYESNTFGMKTSGSTTCDLNHTKRQKERIPAQWMLRKITHPDFIDGNGNDNPTDSRNSNKGSWFYFTYYKLDRDGYRNWEQRQVMSCAKQNTQMADYFSEFHIANIYTPNQRASFSKSSSSKRDELWFNDSDEPINGRILLAGITIFDKNNKKVKIVDFTTDYDLRKNHLHSLKERNPELPDSEWDPVYGNDSAGCLRLTSIRVGYSEDGVNFNYLPPIKLEYVVLNPDGWDPRVEASIPTSSDISYYVEKRDVWGYYCPSSSTVNEFNANGLKTRAVDLSAGEFPYAAAWSLQKIVFPTGKTIKWDYESQRYDRANGQAVTSTGGAPKYCGGVRVKKVTAEDDLGGREAWSYFYIHPSTPGNFTETNTNSSGYASVEPYNYISDIDNRPALSKGGLYTPAKIGYEKVAVVKNMQGDQAPNGYTVYEFTHSGDPAVEGYYPNPGVYGDIDCSWKRGLLFKTTQYTKDGKMVDSAFNGYTFASQDTTDYSYPDIENKTIITREYNGYGSSNYGWARLDSSVTIHMGVRKRDVFQYCDKNPDSKDYARIIIPKSCMKYSSSAPTLPTAELTPFTINSYTRTAMVKGTGAYSNTAVVYVARGLISGPDDEHVHLQAIYNVDITPGNLNMDNVQWTNVKPILNTREQDAWILTGMDAIAYDNDNVKNDLLLQFVSDNLYQVNGVKLILLQNVRVEGDNIRFNGDVEIPLRLHDELNGFSPSFQCNSLRNFMEKVTCSAVCNLEGGSLPDIVFYNADHGASYHFTSYDQNNLYVMEDVDLHARNPWQDETGTTVNSVSYDYSKSVKAHIVVQDPNNHYPEIGCHACFLDLDNDGKQNDWVATDMCKVQLLDQSWRTTINDVVVKDITANPAAKTITFPAIDPTLRQTTQIVNPVPGNFDQGSLFSSVTNTFGLVTTGDLSQKIYPFHFPAGGNTLRTLLYGTSKVQAEADLDGQPNEVWAKAPQNKYLVTKSIPAYWKSQYSDMLNKHMLTQPCQTITYEKPVSDATPLSDTDVRSSQATTWSSNLGNGTWAPSKSYVWNVPKNQSGIPLVTFNDFDFASPPSPPNVWQLTGIIEKYDRFSTPFETKNSKGIYSSAIYRNDFYLPIGTVANSKFGECAVFTCDYDLDVNGSYFDEPNGWKHYNNTTMPSGAVCAIESVTPVHFGEKCLHVKNCQAAAKTIVVHSATAKMTWSAWVRPIDDKPIRFAASLVENGIGNNSVFYDYEYNTLKGLKADGTWQFVKFTINITKPAGGTLPPTFDGAADEHGNDDGIYVWVGNHEYEAASDFYIEDIRIYPAKSLVTTTYYESKWQQPILTVDANGNPSQKVEYDEFARPVRWKKIDKKTANSTLLQEKKYHLRVELEEGQNVQVLYPDFGGVFNVGDEITISWVNRYTDDIGIYCLNTTSGEIGIESARWFAGYNEYKWTIPAGAVGVNKIQLRTPDGNDDSDLEFTVNP